MYRPFILSTGVVLVFAATAALAQGRVDRSFDPSPRDCSDVKWSQAALKAYPDIAGACQGVQMRDGKTYVKFEGTVDEVLDGGEQVRVDFKEGGEVTLSPPPNTTLYVAGKETSFADLRRGAELNFYVPEDRLQAEFQPATSTTRYIVVPIALVPARESPTRTAQAEDRSASELPATASMLPWFAVSGAALLLLGAGLTFGRKLRG